MLFRIQKEERGKEQMGRLKQGFPQLRIGTIAFKYIGMKQLT